MVFFRKSIMNGATLFGVGITLFALSFLDDFDTNVRIILILSGAFYTLISGLAFAFPKLSE